MLKNKISITIVILRICVILFVLLFLLATDFSSFHTGNGDLSEEESGNAATENVGTSDLETEEPTESIPPTGTTKIPSTSVSPDGIKEESATALPPSSQEAQESGAVSTPSQQPSTFLSTGIELETMPAVQETQESSAETTSQQTTAEAVQTGPAQFVVHGNSEEKEVAFTFDDSGEGLSKILEILDQNGIKGSFFLVAGELRKNPELWQDAAANGHLILNHTVNHYTDLAQKSDETIKAEILGWEDAAKEVLGEEYLIRMKKEFAYFRSPGGLKSDRLLTVLGELGYSTMFYWTVEDVYFSKHNPDGISIADHYVQDASNGGVFLMHPGNWGSLDEIIRRLTENGYAGVSVSEILD